MYVGHINNNGEKEELKCHLYEVAKLCSKFAQPIGMADVAYAIGLFHDVGKYSEEFQHKINVNPDKRVDHSTAGGQLIDKMSYGIKYLAYPIMGHHGGLPNGGSDQDSSDESTLHGRLKKQIHDYQAFESELKTMELNIPNFNFLEPNGSGSSISLLIRMFFSCLVDSDFLATEAFMNTNNVKRDGFDEIDVLYDRLEEYIENNFSDPKSELDTRRNTILNRCREASNNAKGLYSLSVPTGGGKTISSLLFALKHAKKHNLKRVIYVIPYTSIIEQNAKVFEKIIGKKNVIEHHSNITYFNQEEQFDLKYLATENWDAPIIVTTNVQFFESFFSSKTSKCRKLHNIIDSVIIFDEAQMFPTDYLKPCLNVISNLVYSYNCTAVLCTATQPNLQKLLYEQSNRIICKELIEDKATLYNDFRRTSIQDIGYLSDEDLFNRLNSCDQVLCIVNTKRHAQALFEMIDDNKKEWFHLSTLMSPFHRRLVLRKIKQRLNQSLSCKVISTSLVEAGVDLDFPVVYRAYAGLDSIIQAAGRCNREGKQKNAVVYTFKQGDEYRIPDSIKPQLESYNTIKRYCADNNEELDSLDMVSMYYKLLFQQKGDNLDKKEILTELNKNRISFPFREIDNKFNLIEEDTINIVIPFHTKSKRLLEELIRMVEYGYPGRQLLRAISQYSISIYNSQKSDLISRGYIEKIDDNFYYLKDIKLYDKNMGMKNVDFGRAYFID